MTNDLQLRATHDCDESCVGCARCYIASGETTCDRACPHRRCFDCGAPPDGFVNGRRPTCRGCFQRVHPNVLRAAKHATCGTDVVYRAHRHTRACYDEFGRPPICGVDDTARAWCPTCDVDVPASELDVAGPHAFAQVP